MADSLSRKQEWDYVWDATPTMTERAAYWLQSRLPLPGISVGLDGISLTDPVPGGFDSEKQKELFYSASADGRLQFLKAKRQQQVLAENPEAAAALEQGEEISSPLASITREIADPASLILPAGTGLRGLALSGSLYGAAYDVVQQNYEQQAQYNPGSTLLSAAIGGTLAPVLGKVAKEVPELARVVRGKPTKRAIAKAADQLGAYEDEFIRVMAKQSDEAYDPAAVAQQAKDRLGWSDDKYYETLTLSGREAGLPVTPSAAREAVQLHDELLHATAGTYDPQGGVAKLFGNISTQVRKIDEEIFGKLRSTEFSIHKIAHDRVLRAKPFTDVLRKQLSREERIVINRYLDNGEFDAVRSLLKQSAGDDAVASFDDVTKMLGEVYDDLAGAGVKVDRLDNYFPRQVRDVDGFYQAIGRESQEEMQKQLAAYAKRAGVEVDALPEWDKANFYNHYLRGFLVDPSGRKMGNAKARTVSKVYEEIQPYYHDAADALDLYLIKATKNAEKYKFFGRGVKVNDAGILDVKGSVGNVVANKNLTQNQILDLKEILEARFVAGEMSPSKTMQKIRNLGYMTTLANPFSAAIQLADVGLAKFGTRGDILPAMFKSLTGKMDVDLEDLGLGQLMVEELSSAASSIGNYAKALDRAMTWGGFKAMDQFGKNTVLNAALQKNRAIARGGKQAIDSFRKEWGKVYGEATDQVLADLRSGRMTDNVKLHLWNILSDVQPVSLSEMPQKYLENPNGRLFYALKSFGLKQLDLLRRRIGGELKKGNYREATQAAAGYLGTVIPAGVSVTLLREMMQGREVSPEDIPDYFVDHLLRLGFMSQYTLENLERKGLSDSIANIVAPPMNLFEDGLRDTWNIIKSAMNGDDVEEIRSVRNIPVFGKAMHNLFMGGNEAANERREESLIKDFLF